MSGLGGEFETRSRGSLVINAQRSTPSAHVQFRKSELVVRRFLNSEIPPSLARDQMVPCLCAFQYRFLLRCTSPPLPRSPELRRCVGRDFFQTRASDNPTRYKVHLPCD